MTQEESENMKVIRRGYEKEITCPKCGSLLLYVQQDIHLVGDMEGEYSYCVRCPECNNNIKIREMKYEGK